MTKRKDEPLAMDQVPLAELHEDTANVRRHSPRNLGAIKASLVRFGQRKPIVVGPGNIVVAGNGTLQAARELGWTEIAIVRTKLTGADAAAFAIADNRTAELAEWDGDGLARMLETIREQDKELLQATGFDGAGLDLMVADATLGDIDMSQPPERRDVARVSFAISCRVEDSVAVKEELDRMARTYKALNYVV